MSLQPKSSNTKFTQPSVSRQHTETLFEDRQIQSRLCSYLIFDPEVKQGLGCHQLTVFLE